MERTNIIQKNEQGFTLLEVMMSLTLFGIFIGVYYATQGYNISDSKKIRQETILYSLCDRKLNEIVASAPTLTSTLTLSAETMAVEGEGMENYELKVEYKKMILPDFATLLAAQQEKEGEGTDPNSGLQAKVLGQIKNNIENMIWQLMVTARNKKNGASYSLTTWLSDSEAPIELKL
ncbi:MAG: prepilin-type N-terminal cleavage/methylation domain-containing protein [Bacteriovoracaceae bacterium]|nr:prepilin-type N-terminal cleavage/methylation domain-containing protein [Bacteriovoracaceae bacterium]